MTISVYTPCFCVTFFGCLFGMAFFPCLRKCQRGLHIIVFNFPKKSTQRAQGDKYFSTKFVHPNARFEMSILT